jgi:hypothetical protein
MGEICIIYKDFIAKGRNMVQKNILATRKYKLGKGFFISSEFFKAGVFRGSILLKY